MDIFMVSIAGELSPEILFLLHAILYAVAQHEFDSNRYD